MEPWERVDDLARAQHGAVTRRQIVQDAGVSGRVLTERVREQGWRRPHRGVYLLPGTQPTYQQEASAALLAVGGLAALTGLSAAFLHDLVAARPAAVEVALAWGRRKGARQNIVLRRHQPAALEQRRRLDGLCVASLPVMLLDLAKSLGDWPVAGVVARMHGRRMTTLAALQGALDQLGPVAGAARLQRVLRGLRGELSHSGAERVVRRHVAALGVELWPRPYPVVDRDRVVAEVDLAVPEVCYGAQVDGPHHLLAEQAAADRSQDRRLGRLGWTIDRFGVDMVERAPRTVAREIVARLATLGHPAAASAAAPHPWPKRSDNSTTVTDQRGGHGSVRGGRGG